MLHSQDNLHAGPSSPVSLATSDITALLPSNEDDFAKGYEPKSRAALADTPPALENPGLIADSGRSLFASLIQTHYFWGKISRRAVAPQDNKSLRPWEPQSEYAQMVEKLNVWEKSLPDEHRWSSYLLKGYKVDGLELVSVPYNRPSCFSQRWLAWLSDRALAIGISGGHHGGPAVQHCPAEIIPTLHNQGQHGAQRILV